MKKSTKIISIMISLVIILSIAGVSNAFSASFKAESSSKLEAGKTVEVRLKIDNIDAGNGINAIGITLDYNKNVFDQVTRNSIETSNDWYIGGFATDTGIFTILRDENVKTSSEILKITLRVKETANVNSTDITFKNISASGGDVASGGTGDIIIPETKVTIGKKIDIENPPTTNTVANEVTNEVANITTNTTTNTVTNTTTNTTNTNKVTNTTGTGSSSGKLPQTGENDIIMVIGILLVAVVAIVAFVKYRDLNIK